MDEQDAPRLATADELEALARELARDYGLSMYQARELARTSLRGLRTYAEQWDAWAAERRPVSPPAA